MQTRPKQHRPMGRTGVSIFASTYSWRGSVLGNGFPIQPEMGMQIFGEPSESVRGNGCVQLCCMSKLLPLSGSFPFPILGLPDSWIARLLDCQSRGLPVCVKCVIILRLCGGYAGYIFLRPESHMLRSSIRNLN